MQTDESIDNLAVTLEAEDQQFSRDPCIDMLVIKM